MNKINFLQGLKDDLYIKNIDGAVSNDLKSFEEGSFLLTTDTYDFYYVNDERDLVRFATDPKETIKELYIYYSTNSNPEYPTTFPPLDAVWSLTPPEYIEGEQVYSINCFIYMDDSFEYSEINELITFSEIDEICENEILVINEDNVNEVKF